MSLRLLILGVVFAFLYGPILWIVVFSFNEGRLVTLWSGFSTKWYGELMRNERLVDAAGLSLVIAAVSATLATILGALSGFALARLGKFRGRLLFAGALGAVLTLPEVILGLAQLLAFVALDDLPGWPGRGAATIVAAHATLGMAYVALVVQARLADFDRSLEEAALDLGATTLPMVVFSSARLGLNPQINALATLMVGIGALAVLSAVWLLGRKQEHVR